MAAEERPLLPSPLWRSAFLAALLSTVEIAKEKEKKQEESKRAKERNTTKLQRVGERNNVLVCSDVSFVFNVEFVYNFCLALRNVG